VQAAVQAECPVDVVQELQAGRLAGPVVRVDQGKAGVDRHEDVAGPVETGAPRRR